MWLYSVCVWCVCMLCVCVWCAAILLYVMTIDIFLGRTVSL